jgi:hypothetical protein
LTADQLGHELALGRATISKLLKLGREGDPSGVRSVRIGSSVRIPRTELDRLRQAVS